MSGRFNYGFPLCVLFLPPLMFNQSMVLQYKTSMGSFFIIPKGVFNVKKKEKSLIVIKHYFSL